MNVIARGACPETGLPAKSIVHPVPIAVAVVVAMEVDPGEIGSTVVYAGGGAVAPVGPIALSETAHPLAADALTARLVVRTVVFDPPVRRASGAPGQEHGDAGEADDGGLQRCEASLTTQSKYSSSDKGRSPPAAVAPANRPGTSGMKGTRGC